MKSRTVLFLVALVIAAVALTVVLERDPGPTSGDVTGQRLLPALEPALNDLTALTVDAGGDEGTITLRRTPTGWVVAERSGYPADAGLIRRLLIRLSEARIVEPKTRNPEYYPRLGLGDVGEDGGGVQVTLEGTPEPVSIIVGNLETRAGSGTYVRVAGTEQTYLVDVELDPARTAVGWLDDELMDIAADEVASIEVRQDDGAVLAIRRIDGRLEVAGLPEGRSLESPAAPQSMAGVLRAFSLDDVRAAADFGDEPPAAVAEYGLEDGRRITVRLWQRDDGRYAAFRVAHAPPRSAEEPGAGDDGAPEASGDDEEAGGSEVQEDVAAQTAAMDARLSPWVFRIPAHKYDLMARRMDDLLAAPTLE